MKTIIISEYEKSILNGLLDKENFLTDVGDFEKVENYNKYIKGVISLLKKVEK